MTIGATFDCSSLPTWNTASCCTGCHDVLNDVRPVRVRFGLAYPIGASVPLIAAGASKVLCCRAHLHATYAMGGHAELNLEALTVAPS